MTSVPSRPALRWHDGRSTLLRTWKFRAFQPIEGVDAFAAAVALKRAMWADLCAMQERHAAAAAPLYAVPAGERDAQAILALRKARTAEIAEIRRAYAARGLAWGDYNAVVFQFDGACRASATRKALPRPDEGALGEAVVRQIMNGARPHHLLSRNDVWIEYLAPTAREKTRQPGSRRSRYRTARLNFLIRTDRHPLGRALIALDMVLHRPLPIEASVVEVRVIRRWRPVVTAAGIARQVERWHVTLAMKLPAAKAGGTAAVGVALDWKGDGEGGANLAVIADQGGLRTIGFGGDHIARFEAARERFARADTEADEAARAAMLAEARIYRQRVEDERRIELRTIARDIVRGAAAICLEKTWLAGKGVKKFTAPSLFRDEIVRAAENAGVAVEIVKTPAGETSKNRAKFLRGEAMKLLSSTAEHQIAEAAE